MQPDGGHMIPVDIDERQIHRNIVSDVGTTRCLRLSAQRWQIATAMQLYYSVIKDMMIERGIAPYAVDFPMPKLKLLARAFGCRYEHPKNTQALSAAVSGATLKNTPTLIEWSIS